MDLSVVVPVRNEAGNIGPLIAEIHAALEGAVEFEVIYVDDGSFDATPAELGDARRRYPRLRVLRHARPCGQSAAIATGVAAARGAWIATLDGDGQNDPADIPSLWRRVVESGAPNPGLVIVGHRTKRRDSAVRRLASRIANAIRAGLLGDRTPDTGCGLKLFAREAFMELPRFDHMHRFLPALFLGGGRRVVSVEVNHRPRQRGQSKYGIMDRLWVGIWDLFGVKWLLRRTSVPEVSEPGIAENNIGEEE
jgi:dolichol-phosphate mannosyltransferase